MILTTSIFTLTLARALGLYVVLVGLIGLVAPNRWRLVIEDMQRSPGLSYVTSVFVFGLGLALVFAHDRWSDPLAIIISLTNWVVLIEGMLTLVAPAGLMKWGAAVVGSPARSRILGLIALTAGVLLLAAGVFGRAQVGP